MPSWTFLAFLGQFGQLLVQFLIFQLQLCEHGDRALITAITELRVSVDVTSLFVGRFERIGPKAAFCSIVSVSEFGTLFRALFTMPIDAVIVVRVLNLISFYMTAKTDSLT